MKTIKLTQGFETMVDDEDYDFLMQWKWHVIKGNSTYYAVRSLYLGGGRKNTQIVHIFMHRAIMKVDHHQQIIDHKNHNGLDNQKHNLRQCTSSGNNRNKSSRKNSTSQFLGVNYEKQRQKWKARIFVEGKEKHLGRFDSEIDAAKAYDEAAIKYHGEFANPNFK